MAHQRRGAVLCLLPLTFMGSGVSHASDAACGEGPTWSMSVPAPTRGGEDEASRITHQVRLLAETGHPSSAWLLARAAAEEDSAHDGLAEEMRLRWRDERAVSIRMEVRGSGDGADAMSRAIRDQLGTTLVRWTDGEQALIDGSMQRTATPCHQQRVGTKDVVHAPSASNREDVGEIAYRTETWSRTCTVEFVGSMRVGSRPLVMGERLRATIEDTTWPGSPTQGLPGNPLLFDQSDEQLVASADAALVQSTVDSLREQTVRLLREQNHARSQEGFEARATAALIDDLMDQRQQRDWRSSACEVAQARPMRAVTVAARTAPDDGGS